MHRRELTRRVRKKSALLFFLLGWFAICIHPVFLVIALFSQPHQRADNFQVGGTYAVSGIILLGIAALFRSPPHAVRRMREERRREKMEWNRTCSPKSERWEEKGQSGTVLVLVLIVVALTAALILEAQVTASNHLRYSQAVMDHVQLRLAAGDAIRHGMEQLGADEESRIDHLEEA